MKPLLATLAASCLIATFVMAQEEATTTDTAPMELVRHVVLFKFKPDAPEEKIREIETAFADLATKIDEVADLEWGVNDSPEGLSQGFTHCFFVTFASPEDRDVYLPHPAHREFVEVLRPYLEEALVMDYTPKPGE